MQKQADWLDRALSFICWSIGTFILLTVAWALLETLTAVRLSLGGSRIALVQVQAVLSLAIGIWRAIRAGSGAAAPNVATAKTPAPDSKARLSTSRPDAESRKMAEAMLTGVLAQVRHEQELSDGTWPEPLSVRLVPQIPIRDRPSPRSWLGGRPRMPADMSWPEVEGTPCDFITQIALADLPAELWNGSGPRQGWLAFFLHPTRYAERLVHVPELGVPRDPPSPPAAQDGWYNPYGWRHKDALQARYMHRALPEWPVDVVASRPGDPARDEAAGDASSALYKSGFDLADPAYHPFDWPSMLALMDSAVAALEFQFGTEIPSPNQLELQFTGLQERLAAGAPRVEAGKPAQRYTPEQIVEMQHRAQGLRELIPASAEARTLGRAALDAVRQIAAEMHADSISQSFSAARAQQLLARMKAINWIKVLRRRDPQGRPGAELIETMVQPITVHHPDAVLFAWDYHVLHFDMARHAYCHAVDNLPAAVRVRYEPLWIDLATKSEPRLGGFPRAYVRAFSPDVDVVLLDLPSNQLMGWQFGDVDSVVLTMRLDEITATRFAEPQLHVSN